MVVFDNGQTVFRALPVIDSATVQFVLKPVLNELKENKVDMG